MNRKSIVLGVILLAGASAVTAVAAVGGQGAHTGQGGWGQGMWGWGGKAKRNGPSLKRLDSDKDGAVTRSEYLKPREDAFSGLDANKDGAVDAAEIAAPMTERSEFRTKRFMKRHDANGDGKVTKEEFEQAPRARFADRDLNGDGAITSADLPPWTQHKRASQGRRSGEGATMSAMLVNTADEFKRLDANGDGVLEMSEAAKATAERVSYAQMRAMHRNDKDKDGRITLEEFTDRAVKRFATLDLNDDGKIAADDLPPGARWTWDKRE